MSDSPPQTFSTFNGTIQGNLDGTNILFSTGVELRRAQVWWNGILMSLDFDCAFGGRWLQFLGTQIPKRGDIVTIQGWI
jgi:hypothetical protein